VFISCERSRGADFSTRSSIHWANRCSLGFPTDVERAGHDIPHDMLHKHKTVLLVDDEASQRMFMRRVLEDAGYNVLEGADYDQALTIHSQYRGKIDVVLTDVSLPGQHGYALVKTLLAIDPGMNAIFISGLTGAEVCRFHGMATTDVHFLEKPFRAADLLRRVRRVLEVGGPFLTRTA
jgi:DNA-binding NtrC family response regulator